MSTCKSSSKRLKPAALLKLLCLAIWIGGGTIFNTPPGFQTTCVAQETKLTTEIFQQKPDPATTSNYNWKVATLGGTQFWTDVRVVGGWRVQRNTYFGHFRLLDAQNVRQAWGEEAACHAILNRQLENGAIQPYRGKVVVLLHGLLRTWQSMGPMADHLRDRGFEVVLFRYASSRETVADHAQDLHKVIEGFGPAVTEINFAGHSLGNIVVRHYSGDRLRSTGQLDPRIKRMVMLGPPNQGSRMARLLKNSVAFKLVAGASGAQLASDWSELEKQLATPPFEFGIIAGGHGGDSTEFSNFLLPGRDDFTVSEQETMLAGARDFMVEPLVHSTMMHQPNVLKATTTFFDKGHFVSEEKRKPILTLPSSRQPRKSSAGAVDVRR